MIVIHIYVPTSEAEEKVDECYGQVPAEIDKICKQDVLLAILGTVRRKTLLDSMVWETNEAVE